MESLIIIGVIIILVGLAVVLGVLFWVYRQTDQKIVGVSQQLTETRSMQSQTTEVFGQIQSSIGRLAEASRHMEEVGKEIASLNDILRAPNLRGGLGELLLGDLLAQMLSPEHYQLQHRFKSGERVDAVIVLKAGMVPVDSKFPLESFKRLIASDESGQARGKREFSRAVKGHVDGIAQKYILPDEGTFDFALMYIPAENVYYETILKEEDLGESTSLLNYALDKHVIPVSPNSFYAYLQAIALGLKGLQIEKEAYQIMQHLKRVEGDFARFRAEYETLGGHIDRAKKKYDEADRMLNSFGDKLVAAGEPGMYLPERKEEDHPAVESDDFD